MKRKYVAQYLVKVPFEASTLQACAERSLEMEMDIQKALVDLMEAEVELVHTEVGRAD